LREKDFLSEVFGLEAFFNCRPDAYKPGAAEKYLKTTTYQLESGWKHHGPARFVLKRKRSDSKGRASMTSSKKPRTSGPRRRGYGGGLVYIESLWGGISLKATKDQIVPHPNSVTGTPGRPQA
jgi:hypothetical protein